MYEHYDGVTSTIEQQPPAMGTPVIPRQRTDRKGGVSAGWLSGSHLARSPAGTFAMVGAAMQAPLAGLPLVLELTHTGFGLMVPMTAATVMGTAVAFYLDGYSIYSARLQSRPPGLRPTQAATNLE